MTVHPSHLTHAKWVRTIGWVVLFVLAVVTPLMVSFGFVILGHRITDTANEAALRVCRGQNEVRREIVKFVDDTVARSKRNTLATFRSPSSSAGQKLAARKNLREIEDFSRRVHVTLAPRGCE